MKMEMGKEKDLTETYKQLKKLIATALGEEELENILNSDVKFVADQLWNTCIKTSVAPIDHHDVRAFLTGFYKLEEIRYNKAIFASIGRGETLDEAMNTVYKNPFINDLSITKLPDFPCRIMFIITLKNADMEPTGDELTQAIEKVKNTKTDFLWQMLVDSKMQENVRVSFLILRGNVTY